MKGYCFECHGWRELVYKHGEPTCPACGTNNVQIEVYERADDDEYNITK